MKIKSAKLKELLTSLIEAGYRVIAPRKENNLLKFSPIERVDLIHFDHINTELSIKEWFLPCTDPVIGFKVAKHDVDIKELQDFAPRTIIFGSRPCDAASLPVMDKVFQWDYNDRFWLQRRKNTTIISIACLDCDYACFCTSVGLDPGSTRGSDLLLTPISDDEYLVEVVSNGGQEIVSKFKELFVEGEVDKDAVLQPVRQKLGRKFDLKSIKPWLEQNFYHSFWEHHTLYCIGCGVCTFVCPTCHCFDIVDEGDPFRGQRQKNWDACQFAMYTVHASGHNPRSRQDERHRQRIRHKFQYYPEKFDETLCVGCGRCVRYCPVDLSIIGLLSMIDRLSQEASTTNV